METPGVQCVRVTDGFLVDRTGKLFVLDSQMCDRSSKPILSIDDSRRRVHCPGNRQGPVVSQNLTESRRPVSRVRIVVGCGRLRLLFGCVVGAMVLSGNARAQEMPALPGLPNDVQPGVPPVGPPSGPLAGPVTNEAVETMLLDKDMEVADRAMRIERMYALAEVYRSADGWFQDFNDLRVKDAIADEFQLDVWKKAVKDHFDRRIKNLEGKMAVVDQYQQKNDQVLRVRRANQQRRLQRLFEDPRYAGKVESAMNDLLVAFSGNPIGYGVGLDKYFATHPSHSRWDLSPEMLEAIRVQSPNKKGGKFVFPLSDPLPLQFDWWPPIFREPVFGPLIHELETKRDQLFALGEQNARLPVEAINDLDSANARLSQAFYGMFPPPWRNMPTVRVLELIAAERHLIQLSREIEAVRDRGTLNAMTRGQYFDPLRDGENVGTLIAWMTRNGMQFAPPRPGSEDVYANLMTQMKDMYVEFGEPLPDPDAPKPKTDPRRQTVVPRPQ
ncbi:hypothetical protein SAMN06265222_101445 [Neorhodopirellula lusitana]|uniref:Uncharacterized protein n=2 Tax=Neorhodopirellula lusitana TaxID=445327 RepID=A0ABY1PQV6_9BACT|nr:hypothetical protein SAMN06265222_101445 [Neorhodopirellula lusitana]